MSTGFRVAVDVPWDSDQSPDWGKPFNKESDAVDRILDIAKKNKGKGFRVRETKEDWGQKRELSELDEVLDARINKKFKVGDCIITWCLQNDVRIMLREVDLPDRNKPMETAGDNDVDFNHGLVFRDNELNDVESWGIRNDRFISGTSQPSMHWARKGAGGCTARAEDFGGAPQVVMWKCARKIAKGGHCGKILYAGHEWMPGWGDFRFVGSYIGHYDHVHAESRNGSGALC
jgi:hypothetical protein